MSNCDGDFYLRKRSKLEAKEKRRGRKAVKFPLQSTDVIRMVITLLFFVEFRCPEILYPVLIKVTSLDQKFWCLIMKC